VRVLFLLVLSEAHVQSIPAKQANLSGTITTTSTLQLVQGQTKNRQGCVILPAPPQEFSFTTGSFPGTLTYTRAGTARCWNND